MPHAFGHPLRSDTPYFQLPPVWMPPMHLDTPNASDVHIFSNTPLYVFRCRNLVLIFFSGMYVLHLGVMGTPLYILMPPCIQMPPNACLYVPNASLCICMFWGYLNRNGGCGTLLFGHPPCVGCLHIYPTPPHIYMLPCMSVLKHPPKAEIVKINSFKTTTSSPK